MPRVSIPVAQATDTGVDIAGTVAAADAAGHEFTENGRRLLYVENSDTASHTVEVLVSRTVEGLAVGPQVITVPAGGSRIAGPFGANYQQGDGNTYVDVPTITGMSLAVLDVG